MIETKMPKDIRAYKTKLIGPFTGRQAICVVIAGIVFIIFYACIAQPFHLPQGIHLLCRPCRSLYRSLHLAGMSQTG